MLIQNCLPIPTCKNTPRGGRSIAIIRRSRSIKTPCIGLTYPPITLFAYDSCCSLSIEIVAYAQLTFEPTTYPLSSDLPPAVHLVRHPASPSAAWLLQRRQAVAQPYCHENDYSDKDEEQQYRHEDPPSSRLGPAVITKAT